MNVSKRVDGAVKGDSPLNPGRVVELPFAFYKIADHIARENFLLAKGEICMCEIIQVIYFLQ